MIISQIWVGHLSGQMKSLRKSSGSQVFNILRDRITGSTPDSGSGCQGSSPCPAVISRLDSNQEKERTSTYE